jgi:alkyldihydroxyacetonephosphate synthase
VALATREGIPLAPFGAGSGVCGGTLPDDRTIVVDMKRMGRTRVLSPSVIEVQAGAMGIRLEEDLQHAGHTLGHFPSSILCSTVGGWLAARSAGQCSGKYGKIEDMVVSLDCVVAAGEVLRLHRRVRGPDLTPLLVGSEGIFGLITSAQLRIHPKPSHKGYAAFSFPDLESGIETLRELFQAGLRPAVSRLYDAFDSFMAKRGAVKKTRTRPSGRSSLKELAMRLSLRLPKVMNFAVDAVGDEAFGGTLLILVFEGEAVENVDDLARATNVAERNSGVALGENPARHWERHRYSVSYRQAPVFMSGAFSDTMEVAAPWSKLGELYDAVREAMRPHVFVMAHLSHAYPDGCSIYFTFAGSADDETAALAKYDAVWREAPLAAARAGGTISHHHGVGRSKAPRLAAELGFGTEVVRALARRLDPAGIFNPGNLLPPGQARRGGAPVASMESLHIDDRSLLVGAAGGRTMGEVQAEAETRGMSLRVDRLERDEPVRAFIARGCPGAPDPFEDPADHFVAGFSATLRDGAFLHVPTGPRKAVGPDLLALFWGAHERAGVIEHAVLRLHRNGLAPRPLRAEVDRAPAMTSSESRWLDALTDAAGRA